MFYTIVPSLPPSPSNCFSIQLFRKREGRNNLQDFVVTLNCSFFTEILPELLFWLKLENEEERLKSYFWTYIFDVNKKIVRCKRKQALDAKILRLFAFYLNQKKNFRQQQSKQNKAFPGFDLVQQEQFNFEETICKICSLSLIKK